ncbi:MAG: glycosyltransferase [Pirellulaceae bacterium]|nr:glycosyltransferase [Pirellulaceae bacterium]
MPIVTDAPAIPKTPRQIVAPVRVLHVINGEHYSGAERVQDLLAMQLPECGFEIEFACTKADRFPISRQSHVPLHVVSMLSRFDLRAMLRVARIVKEGEHEIIHAHTPRSALVGSLAAGLTRVPFVYHVHSPTLRDTTNRWRNQINHWNERFCASRAVSLIAVSKSLGRHMQLQGYSDQAISVVPNGVPVPEKKRDTTLPENAWTVGAVALFRPRKGLEVLLGAIARLKEKRISVNLRVVGPFETKSYQDEIMQHVARLGIVDQIEWVGFTEDVSSELARMDLFVLPSLFGEGLPMVVLEAMAAGVPVVGSRVEGVPEAIDDGINGVLVHPGDPGDLAEKIRQVVVGELDWQLLRENAMQTHIDGFSDCSMAKGVAEVYRKVLAKSAARSSR